MAHHLVDLDLSFLQRTANVFLVREPSEMLWSLAQVIPEPRLRDTGLAVQSELFERLRRQGQSPPVLDARELLLAPHDVLAELCERLAIPFDKSMLRWPTGPRLEDGTWAPRWYRSVHRSTGFLPYAAKPQSLPAELAPLLDECRPHYDKLFEHALRAQPDSLPAP